VGRFGAALTLRPYNRDKDSCVFMASAKMTPYLIAVTRTFRRSLY